MSWFARAIDAAKRETIRLHVRTAGSFLTLSRFSCLVLASFLSFYISIISFIGEDQCSILAFPDSC